MNNQVVFARSVSRSVVIVNVFVVDPLVHSLNQSIDGLIDENVLASCSNQAPPLSVSYCHSPTRSRNNNNTTSSNKSPCRNRNKKNNLTAAIPAHTRTGR